MDVNQLIRSEELGTADFARGIEVFKNTLSLFAQLRDLETILLPVESIQAANGHAQKAIEQFEEVKEVSLQGQSDPVTASTSLVTKIRNEYKNHWSTLALQFEYLSILSTSQAERESAAGDLLDRLRPTADEAESLKLSTEEKAEEALASARTAAAQAGVGTQSLVFKTEAEANTGRATRWLRATIVLTVAALTWAVLAFSLFFETGELSTSETIRSSLARLLVFSLLAFGVGFSSRQHSAARHNETVNRHRQNALQTFEAFVQGTASSDVKDAVLLAATRSVFAPHASGFLKGETSGEAPGATYEVFNRVSDAADS